MGSSPETALVIHAMWYASGRLSREVLIYSSALWRSGCVRIKTRFRRRSGATSRKRNAEASAPECRTT